MNGHSFVRPKRAVDLWHRVKRFIVASIASIAGAEDSITVTGVDRRDRVVQSSDGWLALIYAFNITGVGVATESGAGSNEDRLGKK